MKDPFSKVSDIGRNHHRGQIKSTKKHSHQELPANQAAAANPFRRRGQKACFPITLKSPGKKLAQFLAFIKSPVIDFFTREAGKSTSVK